MQNKQSLLLRNKKLRFNNTYESGRVTFIIFKDKKIDRFIGVCLEFDLEAEAETSSEAQSIIQDYAKLWLENVRENKLPEELLNKSAPAEYWDLEKELEAQRESREKTINNYTSSIRIPSFSIFRLYNPQLPFLS